MVGKIEWTKHGSIHKQGLVGNREDTSLLRTWGGGMGDDVEAMMMKGGNMVQVIFWQVYFLILLLIFALILWF